MAVTEYDWNRDRAVELAWNPKLHPRGWGGRFGVDTKAPGTSSSRVIEHPDVSSRSRSSRMGFGAERSSPRRSVITTVKPKTKVYSRRDVREVEGRTRAQRIAGHGEIQARTAHIRPAGTAQAVKKTKAEPAPISRVQPATQLPSRGARLKLRAGAKIAGARRSLRERTANRPPKFKPKEYVSIAASPADRTMVDKLRRRDAQSRVGQVVSKRPDGKYIVRTVDGNRDVHEAVDPRKMTVIKQSAGDPAPLRPSRELTTKQKIQRARRVWDAYKSGMNG